MNVVVVHNIPIHYKHLLFQAMKKRGIDFQVCFSASGSPIRKEKVLLSPDLYRYKIGYHGPYEEAPALTRAIWTWKSLCDANPKAVLVSGYHTAESWTSWLWALLKRVPLIMWYESNEFDHPRYWQKEFLKRLFLKGCVGAHVYGISNKAYLMKLGMRSEDIIIKRAVVDVDKFLTQSPTKNHRANGTTRLIFVGRLVQDKNPAFLIRAFARVANEQGHSVRLTIAGTGPCDAQLKELAANLGIQELVEFTGYVEQNRLAQLYRQHDFFVLPSVVEPWGLVSLEAMLCRLPVLVSTQCGCASDLVSSETGWTFSPWDEDALTALIRSLCSIPPQLIEKMGQAAYDLAKTYSADNCAELIATSIARLGRNSTRLSSQAEVV